MALFSCGPPSDHSSAKRLQTVIISGFLRNLRRTSTNAMPDASCSSQISLSGLQFHFPSLQDIAEDMGRPLDGSQDQSQEDFEGGGEGNAEFAAFDPCPTQQCSAFSKRALMQRLSRSLRLIKIPFISLILSSELVQQVW